MKDLIKFIEDFSLFTKKCYLIVWSVKKMQKEKIQKLYGKKMENNALSKCAVCVSKKLKFIKEQEASGLLNTLGIKTPLSKILLVGPLLF